MRPVYVQALAYDDDISIIAENTEEMENAVTKWASAIKDQVMGFYMKKSK